MDFHGLSGFFDGFRWLRRLVNSHLELVDDLLALLRAMDCRDFDEAVQAQVWALASGVKATAPRVAVEMKRHVAKLQEQFIALRRLHPYDSYDLYQIISYIYVYLTYITYYYSSRFIGCVILFWPYCLLSLIRSFVLP